MVWKNQRSSELGTTVQLHLASTTPVDFFSRRPVHTDEYEFEYESEAQGLSGSLINTETFNIYQSRTVQLFRAYAAAERKALNDQDFTAAR